jgi:DNA adenine methylase
VKSIPHPIQYQGSKRNLAAAILRYFPKNIDCLIEPFSGSAAISAAAAAQHLAKNYWVNDLNKPLSELLRLMVKSPLEIASLYEEVWNSQHQDDSVEHYYCVRDKFNRTQSPHLFLYLLARSVKGAVRYNANGLFNQSPDKRRFGTRPETMRDNIFGFSTLLKGKTQFTSSDYREVLQKATINDLIYMDPPYQGVCKEKDPRYFAGINHQDFIAALEELNSRNISYLVSYDGRRGEKTFGEPLPKTLQLALVELEAGRSSQATLLGRNEITFESLYLSPALTNKLPQEQTGNVLPEIEQYALFEARTAYV